MSMRQVTITSQELPVGPEFFGPRRFKLPIPMNELSENHPADEKRTLLQAAKADLKQAKAAVKAARKTVRQVKKQVKTLKADLKKSAVKKPRKTKKSKKTRKAI